MGFFTRHLTFSARREAPVQDGKPHAPILVTLGNVTLRIEAGEFSRALGSGAVVTGEVVENPNPKRAV